MISSNALKIAQKLFGGHGLSKNPIIYKIYQKLYRQTLPEYSLYNDQKIFLDSEEAICMANLNFRADNFNLSTFESEIKSGDIVLDVGANIGMYTLNAAKKVGKSGKVYSFEPDPILFSNLKKNVIGNGHNNVILVNKAVSNKNGFEKFATSSKKSAPKFGSHLVKESTKSKQFLTVETISLDDFLENKTINLAKIDVEGSEYDVIKGMKNIIKKNEKLKILIEFSPTTLIRHKVNLATFLDYINTLNFVMYYIDEEKKQKIIVNKKWLLEFAEKSNENEYVNILCEKN